MRGHAAKVLWTDRGRMRRLLYALAGVTFLLAAVYLLIQALPGAEKIGSRQPLAVLIAVAAIGLLAIFAGWRADRKALAGMEGAEAATRERLQSEIVERSQVAERERAQHAAERERLEQERRTAFADLEQRQEDALRAREAEHRTELASRDEKMNSERMLRRRLLAARKAEQEWNRELRAQVFRLHDERGALGDLRDVRQLVVRLAASLLDAEKGVLLSREDEDGDGRLDVVAGVGFERDPAESVVAQRFASEVIERDKTVREDDRSAIDATGDARVDDEIKNLVAIPIYVQDRFSGVVVCANRDAGFEEFDDEVLLSLGDHAGAVLENGRLHGELRGSYLATVTMLAEAIQAKDPFLRGHSDEVSGYVAAVADRLGLDPKRREQLVFASLLHDVGKIGISERILLKPGKLTPEEYSVVQLHPRIGYRLVQQVPSLRPISPAILHHHERFDGDGYPGRLRGQAIPLEARIIAVADSFSAMTAERPYRGRKSLEEACEELERCAGTQFDPEVVRIFVEEVRLRPVDVHDVFEGILSDPELEVRRDGEELILGHGSLAVVDNLTLLYTHRYFHEVMAAEAQRAIVQEDTFGVVLVEVADIDRINKRDGYAAGDAAIRAAAQAVQRAAIRCGGTAARYGGPCLALLAPGSDASAAETLAIEIAGELRDGPSVRAGAAGWRHGETGEEVIHRARGVLMAASDGNPPPGTSPGQEAGVSPATGAAAFR